MGYQALLFCPDEKLARIVAQVFSDLEFNVEPVQEPFSAVKKLMSQRYDALVVDCENESNASLLFKSARNSTSNQGTLAIAVVEGQAGVAKAYRIGANLVLTKPINVEQAKGTLRVARGLLRKNAEAAPSTASPSAPAPTPTMQAPPVPAASVAPASIPAAPVKVAAMASMPPKVAREVPEFEPPAPPVAASAAQVPAAGPAAPVQETPARSAASAEIARPVAPPAPKEIVKPAIVAPPATTSVAALQAAAAAPAKVKEVATIGAEVVELAPDPVVEAAVSEPVGSTPSFSALDLDSSGTAGGSKKILIAAVILIAVAALGYFGWARMSSRKAVSPVVQPVSAPQPSSTPAPVPAATSTPSAPALASEPVNLASEPVSPKGSSPAQSVKGAAQPAIRLQSDSEVEVKTTNLIAPLKVKVGTAVHAKGTAEEASAPVPSPLVVAEANTNALNSLVASSGPTSRPTLSALKISQGVSQGLLIKRVDPKYPPTALAMHVQGSVILDATINREGSITNLTVVKGDKILARAATDAVRQWRYKPYYLDGDPVEIETQIVVNFKLPN